MNAHRVGLRQLVGIGLTAVVTIVGSAPARAAVADTNSTPPPPGTVTIITTANGSGCLTGATVALASDNSSLRVTYPRYTAQVGGSALPTDFRKNCQLTTQIQIPRGFTYAIEQVTSQGRADLASGATALMRENFFFKGASPTTWRMRPFAGPLRGSWQIVESLEPAALAWVPCGATRLQYLSTELRVSRGTSAPGTISLLTLGTGDDDLHSTYRLTWRECLVSR